MDITIKAREKRLYCGSLDLAVRIGRSGSIDGARGREGDGKTPLGHYHLRFGLYRADRLPKPHSKLTFRETKPDDGWCDAPNDAAYNRFVRLPYAASTEALWRDDGAYDIVIVMSHNDSPPVADLGSAVFIHIAQPDDRQTLGCIALTPDDMAALLPKLYGGQGVRIVA
ncbi:L,D-transpeptidase [Fretibacter rubidus]|uniref:L,D-transpeptidase family protein n=1 Tax=Fretibacter rubidus TaxID=570162 RepID=UPI00352BB7B9